MGTFGSKGHRKSGSGNLRLDPRSEKKTRLSGSQTHPVSSQMRVFQYKGREQHGLPPRCPARPPERTTLCSHSKEKVLLKGCLWDCLGLRLPQRPRWKGLVPSVLLGGDGTLTWGVLAGGWVAGGYP